MFRSVLWAAFLAVILSGCGGGGEATPAAPTPAAPAPPLPPPPLPPAATFNATTIARTAATNEAAPVDESITFTVANYSDEIWFKVRSSVAIVDDAKIIKTATGGLLRLLLAKPARLGAGTYTSVITLTLCADDKCNVTLQGTPATFALTYTVTGNPQGVSTVQWSTETYPTELETSDTHDLVFNLNVSVGELPLNGLYLRPSASQTGLIKSMVFGEPKFAGASAYGTYTVTLKAPAALGSGFFTDAVTIDVCLDPACMFKFEDARIELKPNLIIYASDNVVSRRTRAPFNGAQGLAWSGAQNRLYALSGRYVTSGLPAEILALDPVTLGTTHSVTAGTDQLKLIATASDGQGLFVTSRTAPAIRHLQLPALVQDYSIDLGTMGPSAMPRLVQDLLPLAGAPQSILVSVAWDNRGGGIHVYDGVTARPDTLPANQVVSTPRELTPTDSPTTFYSGRMDPSQPAEITIDRLSLGSGGITLAAAAPVNLFFGKLQFANGKLYDSAGGVREPSSGALIDKLELPSGYELRGFIVDATHDRLFAVANKGGNNWPYLFSYQLSTLKFLAISRLFEPSFYAQGTETHTILWGSEGFAYSDGEQLVVMSGRLFTDYTGAPTQ